MKPDELIELCAKTGYDAIQNVFVRRDYPSFTMTPWAKQTLEVRSDWRIAMRKAIEVYEANK